ncbi:MAG: NUDIX domain-containing protein [Acidimicrobiia bacterium]|nr:NUDIX domain-containing protein [Acidimicrobiia bacterium]
MAVSLGWDDLAVVDSFPEHHEPRAAVLAPVFEDEDGVLRTVLIKRPDSAPTHAGDLAFPGGRPHPGDGGPVGTALREAEEEVGIPPESVEVLGFLPQVHTREFVRWVVPVVGRLSRPPNLVPDEREVARIFLPGLEELSDEAQWRSEDWAGHTVWFRELDGDVLWGATARMVRAMLGLV